MITYKTGNIFNSSAQVITNTVNCVGVMGKGLALAYKNKFPEMYNDYKQKCSEGQVKAGYPYLWENDQAQILNFPTKRHWKQASLLEDVEEGLKYLASNYSDMGISSIALPPLGCGLGGLNWADVKNLINKYLGAIEDLDVYVYEATESKIQTDDESQKSEWSSLKTYEGLVAQQSLF
jgi:O-acetyl-ADP-ribose deacetylase (regulator of RNase III)